MIAHWYTPRLLLAHEARDAILKCDPTIRVVVIEGRNEDNCKRMPLVEAAIEKGIPVSKVVCGKTHEP